MEKQKEKKEKEPARPDDGALRPLFYEMRERPSMPKNGIKGQARAYEEGHCSCEGWGARALEVFWEKSTVYHRIFG